MNGRVIEISDSGRYISVYRGFLIIKSEGQELGRVPLSDIQILLLSGYGNSLTTNVVNTVLENGGTIVFCGKNYHPSAVLWPIGSHHVEAGRLQLQINASKPLKKRIWQALVKEKIGNQAAILESLNLKNEKIRQLIQRVGSGDPENLEAQAARIYWPLLMGNEFRRDTDGDGANALLNYGYAVLRAATARGVSASGLQPSLGIHHRSEANAFCLVDDLMEPFRPLVDLFVYKLTGQGIDRVTSEAKQKLVSVLNIELSASVGASSLSNCLMRLSQSLVKSFQSNSVELELPQSPLPMELVFED